ncbi:MAG: hypothetical protein WBA57_22605 [Elainellaceae cyanobacterium]
MGTAVARYSRQISQEEQMIYSHLLRQVNIETTEQMLERFRNLFIDGTRYPDEEIALALSAVLSSKYAKQEFRYVLNRCCHILINRWQSHPQKRLEVPKLIHLFESVSEVSTLGHYQYRSNRRLRDLVKSFRTTDQYLVLKRLARVLSRSTEADDGSRPLGTLIRRYPYLYEHCLLSDDNTREQQFTVRALQGEVQRQFEIDLTKYVSAQLKRARLIKQRGLQDAQRLIVPAYNPTLLSNGMLNRAIKHYAGRVDGRRSYQDLARSFITQSTQEQSFRAFKDDLYQYIVSGVDEEYGKRRFNNQLHNQLKLILPESEGKLINDFLVVRTCSQLLNFLVVDSPRNAQHYVFVDLNMNLGPIMTMGILLRLILLCRKVNPYLERRVSILFSHYESHNRDSVEWLIGSLEMLNVALTTNVGRLDLSSTTR